MERLKLGNLLLYLYFHETHPPLSLANTSFAFDPPGKHASGPGSQRLLFPETNHGQRAFIGSRGICGVR
jgi:hypothetical protein